MSTSFCFDSPARRLLRLQPPDAPHSLVADATFGFTFPLSGPTTSSNLSFDPSLFELPYNPGHARSSSHDSVYSLEPSLPDSAAATTTRGTTPTGSPIRTHGPLLLPKIRTQDQALDSSAPAGSPPKRTKTYTSSVSTPAPGRKTKPIRRHARSYTNPEVVSFSAPLPLADDGTLSSTSSLLCSPINFAPAPEAPAANSRRASTCSLDHVSIGKYGFPTYRHMPSYLSSPAGSNDTIVSQPQQPTLGQVEPMVYQPYAPRTPSPLAHASLSPEPARTTTLLNYLTSPNPAPSLVRAISFPLRDPHTKHYWWDIRQIRPWTSFSASTVLSLPSATSLSCALPEPLLPTIAPTQRHPETETALHSMYASYYLPKLNSALALSSARPLQLTPPPKTTSPIGTGMATDCMFVANVAGAPPSAAAIFGGKPTARVVGLVKSFDRFNTGMRVEGNVKRVEYLRGLAHLHHAMREHGCRYGFILTEIELVFVRNGAGPTPHFGYLEIGSVQLATAHSGGEGPNGEEQTQLTACLALWGLCMLAGDDAVIGHAHWRADIGAPAEGTRRKALPRDDWMPQPQLAEKREAKRARGWIWPEDPVGRKELGKRGVRYGAC